MAKPELGRTAFCTGSGATIGGGVGVTLQGGSLHPGILSVLDTQHPSRFLDTSR